MTDSLKRAQENYRKKCKQFTMRLRKDKDADIIRWLAETENPSSTIKALIRADIPKNPVKDL